MWTEEKSKLAGVESFLVVVLKHGKAARGNASNSVTFLQWQIEQEGENLTCNKNLGYFKHHPEEKDCKS